MLGNLRGFNKTDIKYRIDGLLSLYDLLILDNSLNPNLLESFEKRLHHAKFTGRNPSRFLKEELKVFEDLEARIEARNIEVKRATFIRDEAKRRRLAGESFADKVLDEYRQRIEHYPELDIHPDADSEVARLYGAMDLLDERHWSSIESYFRRAFPRAGQIDRSNIEQRFWRFTASRKGRLPEELERYRRALAAPSATKEEKIKEAQEAMKSVAFYLHDLLDVCEQAAQQISSDDEVDNARRFIINVINDFRIKNIKRR